MPQAHSWRPPMLRRLAGSGSLVGPRPDPLALNLKCCVDAPARRSGSSVRRSRTDTVRSPGRPRYTVERTHGAGVTHRPGSVAPLPLATLWCRRRIPVVEAIPNSTTEAERGSRTARPAEGTPRPDPDLQEWRQQSRHGCAAALRTNGPDEIAKRRRASSYARRRVSFLRDPARCGPERATSGPRARECAGSECRRAS